MVAAGVSLSRAGVRPYVHPNRYSPPCPDIPQTRLMPESSYVLQIAADTEAAQRAWSTSRSQFPLPV
jgi:hypothetical protein